MTVLLSLAAAVVTGVVACWLYALLAGRPESMGRRTERLALWLAGEKDAGHVVKVIADSREQHASEDPAVAIRDMLAWPVIAVRVSRPATRLALALLDAYLRRPATVNAVLAGIGLLVVDELRPDFADAFGPLLSVALAALFTWAARFFRAPALTAVAASAYLVGLTVGTVQPYEMTDKLLHALCITGPLHLLRPAIWLADAAEGRLQPPAPATDA